MSARRRASHPNAVLIQANLFKAVEKGEWKFIPGLISHGADPNALGPKGLNVLHMVIRDHELDNQDQEDVIATLLACGSAINARCKRGCTPLMHVLMSNECPQRLTRLLMRASADPWIVAPRNSKLSGFETKEDVEQYVVKKGHILDFLLCTHRHDETASLMRWALVPFLLPELVKDERMAWLVMEALNNGADPNARDRDGRTAMQIAADRGCPEMVRLLACHGAKDTLGPEHVDMQKAVALGWKQFNDMQSNLPFDGLLWNKGSRWLNEWLQRDSDWVFPGQTDWRAMKERSGISINN